MSDPDKKQALTWYIQGWDLITIAQHFNTSTENLRLYLNNQEN
jgi:hypothetical protein